MRSLCFLIALAACSSPVGTPTGATCAQSSSPLTYETVGREFMTTYCAGCHATELKGSRRHGAPDDDNFDTLAGVMAAASEIDGLAGAGPNAMNADMPPEECTTCKRPTAAERMKLSQWLACEHQATAM